MKDNFQTRLEEILMKEQVYVLEEIAEHGSYTADQAQDRIKELEEKL